MDFKGKHYQFEDVRITPKPVQKPIPTYVASFSKPSIELAARLGCGLIVAPFAAAMSFGGLKQVADLYHESCAKYGNKPGRLMCSYFTHFADNKAQEDAQRARQIRYYKECVIPAFPGDPKTAPPSYRYFIDMVERLQKVKPEDLTENSVLVGSPARITETLKKVEAAGFEEVILYFNVGLKPHAQVKDEMARFMARGRAAVRGQAQAAGRLKSQRPGAEGSQAGRVPSVGRLAYRIRHNPKPRAGGRTHWEDLNDGQNHPRVAPRPDEGRRRALGRQRIPDAGDRAGQAGQGRPHAAVFRHVRAAR